MEGKRILKKLNLIQQKAVLKALTANDYLLLKGLPGEKFVEPFLFDEYEKHSAFFFLFKEPEKPKRSQQLFAC